MDIKTSFFWRITKVPRFFVQKIKNFASKRRKILTLLIIIKSFLVAGPKGVKRKLQYLKSLSLTPNLVSLVHMISDESREYEKSYKFNKPIKFSILVPLYNTPKVFLQEMIESVKNQTYENWELCLADGSTNDFSYVEAYCRSLAKKDKRIKYKKLSENKGISENTNACLEMASGDYIALFDHDDLLHPSALYENMIAICEHNADFIYSDEASFVENDISNMVNYNYKPDFSIDYLRSINYICHLTVFSKKLLDKTGKFNNKYNGSQDHDMILRLTENAKTIYHISKTLYFWRSHKDSVAQNIGAKTYAIEAGQKAVHDSVVRSGYNCEVTSTELCPTAYRIKYELKIHPLVSIIIPNFDHKDDLQRCLESIIKKTTYDNYEIVIIENNSKEQKTFDYYDHLSKKYTNVKIVEYKTNVFNYSKINNFGVQNSNGEYLLLLNNDTQVITPDWIQEMLMFAQREDVGAVGAKLYYPDDTIQHAGVVLGIGGIAGHIHKNFNKNNPGYVARAIVAQDLSAVTAACIMIPRKVFKEVNGFDEDFKVAFNDVDLCMKIRNLEYLIVFTPFAELYHHESKSRGYEDTPEKIKRFNSEIERFKHKWQKELADGDPYYNPNLSLDYEDFRMK